MWALAPWPGIEPGPLHCERRVPATGPPGKSPKLPLTLTLTPSNRHSLGPTHISLGSYHCRELQTTSKSQLLHLCSWQLFLSSQQVARKCQKIRAVISSVQFSSVAQSCPTLCNPMNRSTPGLPVHHQLPEFTQTHVHRVSDAIQPSHPLSSPSPPAPNPSQHQGLFQWVNSSHEVAKVLEFQV